MKFFRKKMKKLSKIIGKMKNISSKITIANSYYKLSESKVKRKKVGGKLFVWMVDSSDKLFYFIL